VRDFIFKLRALLANPLMFSDWIEHVWSVELDSLVCCSGTSIEYPCGCMGVTHRQQIQYYWLKTPEAQK